MKAYQKLVYRDTAEFLEIYNEDDAILGEIYPPVMSFRVHRFESGRSMNIYHWGYVPWTSRDGQIVWLKPPPGDQRDWAQANHWIQGIAGISRGYEQPVEDLELERSVLLLFDQDEFEDFKQYAPDECKGTVPLKLDEFIKRLAEIGVKMRSE